MPEHVIEITDRFGRRRRARRGEVVADGETIHYGMQFIDAACDFNRIFSDGSFDHTHWSRPGFRFADVSDTDRATADDAYEAMRQRLNDGWRNKRVLTPEKSDTAPPRTPTLDQLQADAQKAWEDRNQRSRNAWRTSKEA